ncbi:MAG TPA: anaerobic sulfatase maturase [Anaerolineales bacterium]|nr:anaerobic sulfatase maturase [Anaerolineales bacterium]
MMDRPKAFHIMTKPRGAICNLGCEYCYFLKKEALYPASQFHMSDDVLESYIRQYIQSQSVPQVTFAWQGGEPTLMGVEFFQKAVEFQKRYAPPGMKVENAFQTNGTLLDDTWCQFFKENNVLVGISLDGPAHLHDVYRKDKGGAPTFDRVMRGVELLKAQQVEFNILCTVHAGNAGHPLEVYRFFRDELGAAFIQFIPIVERANKKGEQKGNKLTNRSVGGVEYGQFLIAIFDEWVQQDVGQVFVQIFDVALGKWSGQGGGLCVFEETCGQALAMEHNGDLFSCDHFVEPKHKLGNIITTDMLQMVSSAKQRKFGLDKQASLPQYCLDCEVRFVCNGGCPKNRVAHTPDGTFGLNHLCAGYRAFFNHIDRPMRIMTQLLRQRRAPSEIMAMPWE